MAVIIPDVLILSAVPTPTPVSAEPSSAGNAPLSFDEDTVDNLASATVPVNCAAGILVKFAPLPVTAPVTLPENVVAVMTPEVILFTVTSAAVPSARKIEISPPNPVILVIPDILFGLITVITLFIIPPQNYHQHSEHR